MCSFHEGALTTSSGPDPSTLPIPSAELLRVADGALIGSSRTEDPDDSSADRIRSALASDDIHSFSRSFGVPLYLTPPPDLLPPGRAARNWTWLHAAAAQGSAAILQWLLKPGVLRGSAVTSVINQRADDRTPLLIVAEHRHRDMDCASLAALLRSGASVQSARKSDGWTAAHCASAAGCTGCLRLLLQREPHLVDVHCRVRGEQPLHVAARSGASACVALLCQNGAVVDSRTAASRASTTAHGRLSALHLAARSGSARTVRQLIELGASVRARDAAGRTPLHYALRSGSSRVVAELIDHGANPRCFSSALNAALREVSGSKAVAATEDNEKEEVEVGNDDDAEEVVGNGSDAEEVLGDGDGGGGAGDAECGNDGVAKSRETTIRRFSRLLSLLALGGAPVRNDDLRSLRLGWNEIGELWSGDGYDSGPRRPIPSLRFLCQRSLANSLSAENVLPTLQAACLLGTRRLQHECERMVLQNAAMLHEAGAFASTGARAHSFLQRMLANALGRHAAYAAHVASAAAAAAARRAGRAAGVSFAATYDYYAELDPWGTTASRAEFFDPSDASSGSESCSEDDSTSASGDYNCEWSQQR